jgi:hypothetical protein
VLVVQRVADGPIGPLAGGPLRTGPLVAEPDVDWERVMAPRPQVELQLVATSSTRITGGMVHEGQLYVPCDLGFMGHRIPGASARAILYLILAVKHWHQDAARDGRVVLRIAGNRYERQAVRVTDEALLATLRAQLEKAALRYFGIPSLLDVPVSPDSIWFFRMDARPAQ